MEKVYQEELLFADRGNSKQVVEYMKFNWIHYILTCFGLDLDGCFPEGSDDPDDHNVHQRAKLRKLLKDNEILVLDDKDDSVEIYYQEEIVAIWKKPVYDLRHDHTQLDPNKRNYVGVHVAYWSVFDGIENEEDEQ